MYLFFLRNYSINYFRCFLWCGPKADKEKQRCRRTQSRDRGCHQKSIFSLRFPVRAAFCGPFFLIFALTFVIWVLLLTFDIFCVFCSTLKFFRRKKHFQRIFHQRSRSSAMILINFLSIFAQFVFPMFLFPFLACVLWYLP